VPMFHINAWCIPYAAPIGGSRLVLPGPRLDGASLYELMETERVTVSAGVPTIWLGLMQHVEQHGLRFSSMRRTAVGGSAMPASLIAKFADDYGVEVRHGWGMTETTAATTMSCLTPRDLELSPEQQHATIARQGKSVFGAEIKIVDEAGVTLPRDGVSQGELMVRGQWIVTGYYKGETSPLVDGWFPTGDIATIDAHGVMQIRDRAKDVIKTGGEWISSIDLESAAMGHPAVAMAAVIGVKHPKWDERPWSAKKFWRFSPSAWPNGGCRMTSFFWTHCQSAAPAKCRRAICASSMAACSVEARLRRRVGLSLCLFI
jgi:acyl-CoA synthetase (AMP-forming)/AMP-acid ligase II